MVEWDKITEGQIDKLINKELEELYVEALLVFRRKLEQGGMVMTGDLLESIRPSIEQECRNLYAVFVVDFQSYGRFRDMKFMEYSPLDKPDNRGKKYGGRSSPEDGLTGEEPEAVKNWYRFLEAGGWRKATHVPGGNKSWKLNDPRSMRRLAWTLFWSRSLNGRFLRRGKGWYNEGKSQFIRNFRIKVTTKMAELAAQAMADGIGDS